MAKEIHLIVAIDRHGAIGKGGDQPFYISADLRRFKTLTMGNTIVMGRRTFEALPKGALPGRQNIIVTRNSDYIAAGAEVAHSLDEAIALANKPVFIIGGAEIYRQALPLVDTLHITVIQAAANEPDTYFPIIPLEKFTVVAAKVVDSEPRCTFYTLKKK